MTKKSKASRKPKLRIMKATVIFSFVAPPRTDKAWHKGVIKAKLEEWGAHEVMVHLMGR